MYNDAQIRERKTMEGTPGRGVGREKRGNEKAVETFIHSTNEMCWHPMGLLPSMLQIGVISVII